MKSNYTKLFTGSDQMSQYAQMCVKNIFTWHDCGNRYVKYLLNNLRFF